VSARVEELAEAVEFALVKWGELREHDKARVADAHFQTWLFETIPADFEALRGQPGHDPESAHALLAFEIVSALFEGDRAADAFLVLGWLGKHFVNHPDDDSATRAVMAMTDHCTQAGSSVTEHNAGARRVLRDVVDAARPPLGIGVERALCRAVVGIALLRGQAATPDENTHRAEELSVLWTEIIQRWRHSTDPRLRHWVAHALSNKAFLWLQYGREDIAREQFATIVELFGGDPPELDRESRGRVLAAGHAGAILDRFAIGEPQFKLDYLERQRYWDKRARRKGFGVPWLLAGAPRNHMAGIVRQAGERHRNSTGKLQSWLCAGEPFVLLLRNFKLTEQTGVRPPGAYPDFDEADVGELGGDHARSITFRKCEPALSELDLGVSLIQVASTTSGELEQRPWPGQFVPQTRLYLPDATWRETVAELITVAEQVIVWAEDLTSALADELALLTAKGRTADTLVLLEDEPPDPFGSAYFRHRRHERLRPGHPALHDFPHVVDAGELADRRVMDCPSLARVVGRLGEIRALPLEERLTRTLDRLDTGPP
jgi:hypothetical protein